MKRIVTTNLTIEYNLGGASILYGTYELLKILFGSEFSMTNIQRTPLLDTSVHDMEFETICYSASMKALMLAAAKKRIGIASSDTKLDAVLGKIHDADIVVDLNGICFCYNLRKNELPAVKILPYVLSDFRLTAAAKLMGIHTAKNAASYGPIVSKTNRKMARFASNHLFDVIAAREEESKKALTDDAGVKREVLLSPDTANLMPYDRGIQRNKSLIGISVSHQIVRQWESKENYYECIHRLIGHICSDYHMSVLLIPNEWSPNEKGNDVDVSQRLFERAAAEGFDVSILDVSTMSGMDIKNSIASCEAIVASRYHSCVAALSAGVPTLVLGWHNKYQELMKWYEQDSWQLSCTDCNSQQLVETFDRFFPQREASRRIIQTRYPIVRNAVIEAGKRIFDVGDGKHE